MTRPENVGRAPTQWPPLSPEEQAAAAEKMMRYFEDLERRERSWKRRQAVRNIYLNFLLSIPFLVLFLAIGFLNVYVLLAATPSRGLELFVQLLSVVVFVVFTISLSRLLKKRRWLRRLAFVKRVL